ncbi:hypothetical protein ACLB2K_038186 [Fragaria x ananassa]
MPTLLVLGSRSVHMRKTLDELKLKDLKVKNYLFQAIDRTILDTILQNDTAKQIWDSMKKKYEGNARVKHFQLQALRREFETLEMKVGESVTDYFSRVMSIVNRMRTHGQQMDDTTVVDKILRSLTEKFNYIAYSIEESKNIDEMSVDELQKVAEEDSSKNINPQAEVEDILISPRWNASDVMGLVTFGMSVMRSFTRRNKRLVSS